MMCTDYTYNLLKKDFEANKQIVLFVGAGINYSTGHQILWNDVMEYLFKNVLSSITSANGFTAEETRLLQKLFEQTNCPEIPTDLKKYVSEEFPNIVICNDNGFFINESNITVHKVGSMKEYWRKTENMVLKETKINNL